MYFYYRNKNLILGSIIIFLFFSQLLIWLKLDHTPVTWDPANHLTSSLRYFNWLCHPSINSLKGIIYTNLYPPLVGLSLFPFYLFFGYSADKTVFYQNLIYIPLLLITTYLITKRVNQQKTGILPLLLLATYPQIYEISNKFFLDLPLAAMVSLSIYGLLCTENFTRMKNSFFLGIMLGLGMLTKVQFSMFLLGPFLVSIFFGLKDGYLAGTLKKRSANIIISLLIALLIASFWYLPNIKELVGFTIYSAIEDGVSRGHPFPFSIHSILYYIFTLINQQISFVYIVLFFIGLPFFLKRITREKILIISWTVIPYIIFTFLIHLKEARFILPSLPAFVVITSVGLSGLSKKYLKLFVIPAILIAFLQLLAMNFGVNYVSKNLTIPLFANQNLILFRNSYAHTIPKNKDWGIEKALLAIHQDIQSNGKFKSKIIIFANHPFYNRLTLNYYSISNNLNLEIKQSRWLNRECLHDLIENDSYKYFIFKTWPFFLSPAEKEIYVDAIRFVYSHSDSFQKIFTQKNPDSSFTFIYKRVLPAKDYKNRKEMLETIISPVRIKGFSLDPSHLNIDFEGGTPPYVIEVSSLKNPAKFFYIETGYKQSYTRGITPEERETIKKLGGTAIKVLDVLENKSKYHVCQIN